MDDRTLRDSIIADRRAKNAEAELAAFWQNVENTLRSQPRLTDPRGRLTPAGNDYKRELLGITWKGDASEFEAEFAARLLVTATEKVAAAKASTKGLVQEVRKVRDAAEAFANAVQRVTDMEVSFAKARNTLDAAGLRDVARQALPSAGTIANEARGLSRFAVENKRQAGWAIEQTEKHVAEVTAFPDPTLEDLSTLYADGTPTFVELGGYVETDRRPNFLNPVW